MKRAAASVGVIALSALVVATANPGASGAASRAVGASKPSSSVSASALVSASISGAPALAPVPSAVGDAARAYESALVGAKLAGPAYSGDGVTPYTPEEISREVDAARRWLFEGRAADVVARLVAIVESPRFELVSREPEARAAFLVIGLALAEQGVSTLSRDYLRKAAAGPYLEATSRAATRRLTEIAIEDESYDLGVSDLQPIVDRAATSQELRGELDFVLGRKLESEGDVEGARVVYARISPLSRFWSAATYRRGLIAVDHDDLDTAEALFCAVADPKRQDQSTPVFADERFFAVRDLARLALGRVAHEERRHDDARYYYYLVPQDSRRLAESLYEAATTRYEAQDYDGARALIDELATLGAGHVYDDEAHVLDAYVDLAQCKMAEASAKLDAFLKAYSTLKTRVRELVDAPDDTVRAFLDGRDASAVIAAGPKATAREDGSASSPSTTPSTVDARIAQRLEADPALLFVLRARRRLAAQLASSTATVKQIDGLASALAPTTGAPSTLHAAIDPDTLGAIDDDATVRDAIAGIRAEISALEQASAPRDQTQPLRSALLDLELRVRDAGASSTSASTAAPGASPQGRLGELLAADRATALSIRGRATLLLAELDAVATTLTRDALRRLDRRTSRLVARARLAKIDVVLGRKKGLEVEVDALKQGILPASALDSLQAQRFLGDNEEWWPFEGDEWTDEVVGSEQK